MGARPSINNMVQKMYSQQAGPVFCNVIKQGFSALTFFMLPYPPPLHAVID